MDVNTNLFGDYRRVTSTIRFLEAPKTMTTGPQTLRDYRRIEAVIHFLEAHADEQPSLADVAEAVGLSEFYLQRIFRRWAGISPKRFLQFLTVQHAKRALREGLSVLATAYETGLSGPGRLHDLFVSVDAVTPGEYKGWGRNLDIRYGFAATPFGECLIAATDRGVCGMEFVTEDDRSTPSKTLEGAWPGANLIEDAAAASNDVERMFTPSRDNAKPITLLLKGTNFQLKVWQALLQIPAGAATSYGALAEVIGQPTAAQAVGRAVGRNPIAYLIPCHRVLRESGAFGEYRWGKARKQAMLGWEAARETG